MNLLVVSCSLRRESLSRLLAQRALGMLRRLIGEAEAERVGYVDLAEFELPSCDGDAAYAHPRVVEMRSRVASAAGVILAFPVYNYSASSAAKNLVELTGSAWTGKVVGLCSAAGSRVSFMAPTGLAASLMLDFHTLVVPHFPVVTDACFTAGELTDADATRHMNNMVHEFHRLCVALAMA